ncbi:MAG: hypothetical protein E7040_10225 [Lentisphaerae bacterium]|nr:hypothetical protein [Lentisphaerota bacterium]
MGKFIMSVVAACVAVVFLAGCGRAPSHWQYVEEQGYVNLSRVTYFRSVGTVIIKDGKDKITILDGKEINKKNIEKALKKLESNDVDKVLLMSGILGFDGVKYALPTKLKKDEDKDAKKEKKDKKDSEPEYAKYSKEEVIEVLENWLDIVEDVESNLP